MALDTLLSPDSARYRINPFIGIGIKKKKKAMSIRYRHAISYTFLK